MYTEQEVLYAVKAAAIQGLSQGIDAGYALATTNAPIGSTRNRVDGIVAQLRKDGYIRDEKAVAV